MKLFDDLKRTVALLSSWPESWAICGGIAAAIYRDTPRYTGDIDIALRDTPSSKATIIAEEVTAKMGFTPVPGWITDQHGVHVREQALVIGRTDKDGGYLGIDFLLPILPWVNESVVRAQANLLDYGFAKLPTITIEDILIAKLFAYQGTPGRVTDIDDIHSILRTNPVMDLRYLHDRIDRYTLIIPSQVNLPGKA